MSNPADSVAAPPALTAETKMGAVLAAFPGARRALFARYHIGGCQTCGFDPAETLGNVCARNDGIPVEEAIDHILASHRHDEAVLIRPDELADLIAAGGASAPTLIDIRTREEFDAVRLPGAQLLTNELNQVLFASPDRSTDIVLYDHTGERSLDAAAYLIGHGFGRTRALAGGIDAYARDIDPALGRYRLEFES